MAHDLKIADSSIEAKLPSSFSVKRVVTNVDLFFSPISVDSNFQYHVHDITGDIATLTTAVHKDIFKPFTAILESMAKATFQIDRSIKHKALEAREVSLDEIKYRDDYKSKFSKSVCGAFKKYIKQGMTKNEAISATNHKLKNYFPLCAYHLVREELSTNGMFRKP